MKRFSLKLAALLSVVLVFVVLASQVAAIEATRGGVRAVVGFARIAGATVGAVGTNTLTISKNGKPMTVNILATTKLRRKFWGNAVLGEISIGDLVNVWGGWTDSTQSIINGRLVRDVSIQKRNGVFVGTVTTLTSAGWVMETFNRGTQTASVSSTTKFTNRTGKPITQADVVVGNMVRLRGMWNDKLNTITEVTAVKDYSIPVKAVNKVATPSADTP